jgi:hypothetical protein
MGTHQAVSAVLQQSDHRKVVFFSVSKSSGIEQVKVNPEPP